MSEELDIEADAFLKLLTDALRAGPGSPEWHEATEQLRARGAEGDEYRMLCAAREHLESGRQYRSIRPGPLFTRKVMDGVEQEAGRRRGRSWATWIAVLSGALILAVVATVLYRAVPRGGQANDLDQLGGVYFLNTVLSASFNGSVGQQWRAIGSMPLDAASGLRPTTAPVGTEFVGGGIVSRAPIPSSQAFQLEVALRTGGHGDDQVAQVFVTDQTSFGMPKGMSGHELTFTVQGESAQVVLPAGTVEPQSARLPRSRQTVLVRISISGGAAIVEMGGKKLYAGASQLDGSLPRYVGVRFLRRDDSSAQPIEPMAIESIKVMLPR